MVLFKYKIHYYNFCKIALTGGLVIILKSSFSYGVDTLFFKKFLYVIISFMCLTQSIYSIQSIYLIQRKTKQKRILNVMLRMM